MIRSPTTRGALLMMGSMTAFTCNDAFMKWLGQSLPFFQILTLRSVGVVLCLGVALLVTGAGQVSGPDRRLIAIRTGAEIGAAFSFISALFHLPIATVTAVIQALPLTVTLGAALLFGEPVGWRRYLAIGIGLIGVLIIVRPGADSFSAYTVYALLAVVCVTIRDLAARRLSAEVRTLTVAFAAAVGVLLFAGAGSFGTTWQPMTTGHAVALTGAVFFIIGGYLFSVSAMRTGAVAVVAQFRYFSLVVALILGLIVFDEWPDFWTFVGAAIVVGTGLYTLWRERRRTPAGLRPR